MIGEVISNYKILSVIGEGGMGVVYLAEHIHLSRKAAIKALHQKLISNNHIRERFRNEAATLSQIEHPNIVKLYDYVEKDNGLYLIMEYVDGVPLDEYIVKESGPISEGPAIKIMSGMLAAFSYAHKKNIVHRDVKPSNVIISRDFGIVKILDFGIAKILGDDSRNLTKDGTQMGTIYYMSPEQVKGTKLDKRSDIYSLGVTFLQIVTGTNPYESLTTEFDIYTHITQTDLPDAKSIYPYVSDKIVYVIKKATQKNVADRYQDCDQMLQELNDDQLNIPVINTAAQVEYNPAISHDNRNKKTGRKLLIGGGIAVMLIVAGILVYFFGGLKEYIKWKDAEVLYTYVNSLGMRSDTTTFSDGNRLPVNLLFGDSVKILRKENLYPWAEGKFNDIEGYVNTAYMFNIQDFQLLSRIFTNNLLEEIKLSKYRKSILDYYKLHSFTPDIPVEEQAAIFGDNLSRTKWVLEKTYFSGKPASIYSRRSMGGYKTDFCLIPIRNSNTGVKKCLLFIYNNDKEVHVQLLESIDPMSYYDFNTAYSKLIQYGLYLNRSDMYVN